MDSILEQRESMYFDDRHGHKGGVAITILYGVVVCSESMNTECQSDSFITL